PRPRDLRYLEIGLAGGVAIRRFAVSRRPISMAIECRKRPAGVPGETVRLERVAHSASCFLAVTVARRGRANVSRMARGPSRDTSRMRPALGGYIRLDHAQQSFRCCSVRRLTGMRLPHLREEAFAKLTSSARTPAVPHLRRIR